MEVKNVYNHVPLWSNIYEDFESLIEHKKLFFETLNKMYELIYKELGYEEASP